MAENVPLRLFDCFLLVMPLLSEALGASLEDGSFLTLAAFLGDVWTGLGSAEFRKSEGEGMVIVSAICGDAEGAGRPVRSPAWKMAKSSCSAGRRSVLHELAVQAALAGDGREVVSEVESGGCTRLDYPGWHSRQGGWASATPAIG
jgi:hypothetical protein